MSSFQVRASSEGLHHSSVFASSGSGGSGVTPRGGTSARAKHADAATGGRYPSRDGESRRAGSGRPDSGVRPQSGVQARNSDILGGWGSHKDAMSAWSSQRGGDTFITVGEGGQQPVERPQSGRGPRPASGVASSPSRPVSARADNQSGRPMSARPGSARGGLPQSGGDYR